MSILNNAAARAAMARQIAADSKSSNDDTDPRDVLGSWERDVFFAFDSVQLRIPLLDPAMVRRHLELIEGAVHELRFKLDRSRGDRADLLMVHGAIKGLNQKVNAYRSRRNRVDTKDKFGV